MHKLPLFQKGVSGGIRFSSGNRRNPFFFPSVFIIMFLVAFSVLALRLFQLTVVKGSYYRRLSEQNRIRELTIEPRRGAIIDRKGFAIAQSSPADIRGNDPRLTSRRTYQGAEAIAPLVGYRQMADAADFKNDSCAIKLKSGDKIGKKGVEKLYDCDIRGKAGDKLVEVDASGKYVRTISVIRPIDGSTLQLAVDLELQKKTYEVIKDKRAAVVALKPKTGEVLLLVSSPSFNPQDFEDGNQKQVTAYLKSDDKPLFNRALEATYPPGSLFKLVLATGALEEKKIDQDFQIEDTGVIKAGSATFGNWYFLQYGKTEGMVTVVKAIRRSNDIFFYKIGELLGVTDIKSWAQTLGYGKKTGLGLDEADGLVPSTFWKEETLRDRWYLGDTYNLSIGQGFLLTTPLQVTQVTNVVASNGLLCQPKLLKNDDSRCKKLPISQKTLDLVREGMKEACSTGGTGWPFFDFGINPPGVENKNASGSALPKIKIQTACKTGTAESSQIQSGVPHAWITVFAPYENPEIALTVLVEEGGQGSDIAGPIAKEILKSYFERSE